MGIFSTKLALSLLLSNGLYSRHSLRSASSDAYSGTCFMPFWVGLGSRPPTFIMNHRSTPRESVTLPLLHSCDNDILFPESLLLAPQQRTENRIVWDPRTRGASLRQEWHGSWCGYQACSGTAQRMGIRECETGGASPAPEEQASESLATSPALVHPHTIYISPTPIPLQSPCLAKTQETQGLKRRGARKKSHQLPKKFSKCTWASGQKLQGQKP